MFFTNTEAICVQSEQSSTSPKCPIHAALFLPAVAFVWRWLNNLVKWFEYCSLFLFSCPRAPTRCFLAPCLRLWATNPSHLDNKCALNIKPLCVTLLNYPFVPCEVCASNQVGEISLYCPINMSHCFILQAMFAEFSFILTLVIFIVISTV